MTINHQKCGLKSGFKKVLRDIIKGPDDKSNGMEILVVYYESIHREIKTRPIYECRYDERLKSKTEGSTCLTYTGLIGELEHLKIETRLIDEKFASVMGECVI